MRSPSPINVAIVGASGYTGGEVARLLLARPNVRITQVTSERHSGAFLHSIHPNLRPGLGAARNALRFTPSADLEPSDVLILAQPHGAAMRQVDFYRSRAPRIIDLSADFRLRDPEGYPRWYGHGHPRPDLLGAAVYGLPELHRAELPEARLVTGAGCVATAAILGMRPLVAANILDSDAPLLIEAKVGSSAAGAEVSLSSHHPERSGAVRSFSPTGHRHTAEIMQELPWPDAARTSAQAETKPGVAPGLYLSATAVELVRGVLITAQAFLRQHVTDRDLWSIYREAYGHERFIRIIKERAGVYRYPEPKTLVGSNFCDIGFAVEPDTRRVVVMAALDNLMKGAAGNAVQALNVMMGWDETLGLAFTGLHPV